MTSMHMNLNRIEFKNNYNNNKKILISHSLVQMYHYTRISFFFLKRYEQWKLVLWKCSKLTVFVGEKFSTLQKRDGGPMLTDTIRDLLLAL